MAKENEIKLTLVIDGKEVTATLKQIDDGVEAIGDSAGKAARRGGQAIQSFNYVLQDGAQFTLGFDQGVRAIANNVPMLVQHLGDMRQELGSGKAVLSQLASGFTGPMGLLTLVSLATTLFVAFGDQIVTSINDDVDPEIEKLKEDIAEILDGLARMPGAARAARQQDLTFDLRDTKAQLESLNQEIEQLGAELDDTSGAERLFTDIDERYAQAISRRGTLIEKQRQLSAAIYSIEAESVGNIAFRAEQLRLEVNALAEMGEETDELVQKRKQLAELDKRIAELRNGPDGDRRKKKEESSARAIAELRLRLMQDGLDKELAAIDLRYQREMETIRKHGGDAAAELEQQLNDWRDRAKAGVTSSAMMNELRGLAQEIANLDQLSLSGDVEATEAEMAVLMADLNTIGDQYLQQINERTEARQRETRATEAQVKAMESAIQANLQEVKSVEDATQAVVALLKREISTYLALAAAKELARLGLGPIGTAIVGGIAGIGISSFVGGFFDGFAGALGGTGGGDASFRAASAPTLTTSSTADLARSIEALPNAMARALSSTTFRQDGFALQGTISDVEGFYKFTGAR